MRLPGHAKVAARGRLNSGIEKPNGKTVTNSDFAAIVEGFDPAARVSGVQAVAGGSIHAAWRVDTDAGPFFVKTAATDCTAHFVAQATGLARIAATQTVRVPAVHCHGAGAECVWLALEWLDLRPLDAAAGAALGEQLAALHHTGDENFGFETDNFLGSTLQDNRPHCHWPWLFAHRRLQPQLELAARRGLERPLVDRGFRLVEKLAAFFLDRRVTSALVHGDLWSGNAAMLPDGTPVIYDPAIHFADRETDLAMTELFGGFPGSFYAAYRRAAPLAEGYEQRKTLYNLYHLLNHFNLFGGAYLSPVRRAIDSLLTELR